MLSGIIEYLKTLNWIDLIVIILVLGTAYFSYGLGVIHQVIPLLCTFAAWIIGLYFYSSAGAYIANKLSLDIATSELLAFSVIVLIFLMISSMVNRKFYFDTKGGTIELDRILGVVVGVLRVFILIAILLVFVVNVPLGDISQAVGDAKIGMLILGIDLSLYVNTVNFLHTKILKDTAGQYAPVSVDAMAAKIYKKKDYQRWISDYDPKKKSRFFNEKF